MNMNEIIEVAASIKIIEQQVEELTAKALELRAQLKNLVATKTKAKATKKDVEGELVKEVAKRVGVRAIGELRTRTPDEYREEILLATKKPTNFKKILRTARMGNRTALRYIKLLEKEGKIRKTSITQQRSNGAALELTAWVAV